MAKTHLTALEVEGAIEAASLAISGTVALSGAVTVLSINGFTLLTNAGAPDSGVSAVVNALCIDTTNSDLYINEGDAETPVWRKFTRATS